MCNVRGEFSLESCVIFLAHSPSKQTERPWLNEFIVAKISETGKTSHSVYWSQPVQAQQIIISSWQSRLLWHSRKDVSFSKEDCLYLCVYACNIRNSHGRTVFSRI